MLNEGVFRSPKWLRNFLDFEVNTGDDIKGEPSKRAIAREEKRKKVESLKRWDEAWAKAKTETSFNSFLNGKYNKSSYNTWYSYDLEELRRSIRGDHSIFQQYKGYLDEKEAEERRREELNKEIDEIIDRILRDFNSAPYRDKIDSYYNRKRELCVKFTFENGDKLDLFEPRNRMFKYSTNGKTYTYTINLEKANKLIGTINEIVGRMRSRPYNKNKQDYYGSGSTTNKSKDRANDSDPKRTRYNTLLDTIEHRKKQLSKMSKDDGGREALENELKAAERMAKRMKDEYHYENLKSFRDFND